MAKATTGSVTLELTPQEAKALHAVTGGTTHRGMLADELTDVYDALESAGVSSDAYEMAWDKDAGAAYLKEA